MPSITEAVATVYRDLLAVARALAGLMLVAIALVAVTKLGPLLVPSVGSTRPNAAILLGFTIGLVQVFLLTPYFISIHRFILLGERATTYALAPLAPRFQLFFTVWAAFSVLAVAPLFLLGAWPAVGSMFLAAVWLVAMMIAGLRLIVLFPAISVDSPAATVAQALADTKGHAWRIFVVGVLAALPMMIVGELLGRALGLLGKNFAGALLVRIVDATVGTIELTLFMVIAARFHQWLGQRAKPPE